jgi:hypothetical protein
LLDEDFQNFVKNVGRAVATYLHRVFACVGVGRVKDGDKSLVKNLPKPFRRGVETCEVDGVGCAISTAYGTEGRDDRESIRTTDADDA